MAIEIIAMLFAAGLVSGCINALAGGSSLLTFPVLMAAGLPPIVANASNFVAALPGNAAAVPAYKKQILANRREAAFFVAAGLAGGAIGSTLLMNSTDTFFLRLVPWLIATATLLYAFGGRINAAIIAKRGIAKNGESVFGSGWAGVCLIFLFAIYGGYFGAGLGVIMLSVLKIMGYLDFHDANALKNLINTAIGVLGVTIFAVGGLISWPEALVMMTGSTIGGYFAVRFALQISQTLLSNAVVILGFCLSIYYFLK